jgi:diguanylate cyclase (GGDEF)-like protein
VPGVNAARGNVDDVSWHPLPATFARQIAASKMREVEGTAQQGKLMFRLLRYFSIASFVSMVLAAIVLSILHQLFEKDHLLRFGERQNIALAQAFSNNVWPKFRSFAEAAKRLDANALRHQPAIAKLRRSMLDAARNTPTVRMTIYQLDGRTLFSTDNAEIGAGNGNVAGFLLARQGQELSEVTHYDKFSAFNGEFVNRDVLSSYIPLRGSAQAPIEGVIAIYTDVTDLEASDEKEELLVTLSVIAVLSVLYGILFIIVRHADRIIRRQYEHQRRIERSLRHMTTHDALTNLPNRLLLLDRINQSLTSAERHNNLLAVAFIDLDNFQNVNNSLGHHISDKVLQTMAQRLANCVRGNDTISRLGADEFVVSLPEIKSNADLFQIAKKMLGAIALPIEAEGRELHLTASIGIALYPEHGTDAETLLSKADMAMHNAKSLGGNRHQMFVEHMSEEVRQQVQMEDEMWRALENNEFVLHYQPVVDLKSGAIIGAEALLRWPNANGTWPSPEEFIPISEKCGLIIPLSEWILSEACTQLQAWQEMGHGLSDFTMAVNLSPRHFATAGLATMIAGLVEQAEIDPASLHLEITDRVLTDKSESTAANFEGLKRIGIKFSLDDFGTGYSSLGYLRSFPIGILKINRMFVQDLPNSADNSAIVTTIIALANSLGLTVIAEGVENKAQLSFLEQHGCNFAQGFLFSRPLPANEFLSLILQQRDMRIHS